MVASYSFLLLASLQAYGARRSDQYLRPAKWQRNRLRPSCLDLISLLRKQAFSHPELLRPLKLRTDRPGGHLYSKSGKRTRTNRYHVIQSHPCHSSNGGRCPPYAPANGFARMPSLWGLRMRSNRRAASLTILGKCPNSRGAVHEPPLAKYTMTSQLRDIAEPAMCEKR
jgi:hypothetical protein